MYHIKTEDVDQDIAEMKEHYDNANFPKDHICYCSDNDKVIGKFKNESPAKEIVEFAGPSPKVYSLKIHQGNDKYTESKKGKGVSKCFLKTKIVGTVGP